MGLLYVEYDVIARAYAGWTLTEIKRMNFRQREHWMALVTWRREAATV